MKSFLYFLLGLLGIGFTAYVLYTVPTFHKETMRLLTYNACDTPLPYKVGDIDSRFHLSRSEVIQDTKEATSIWSSAEGKPLFIYSPSAALTVNFVYDERQKLTTSINQLDSNLAQKNKSLSEEILQYNADVAALKQEIATFNALVDSYNQNGGATRDQYNALVKQQQELNAQGDALNQRAQELNLATNNYNDSVSVLNKDIHAFNTAVAAKPEQGLYDGRNSTITIYFANNTNELIHTLTHEFGHALGMDHVQDENAIMDAYANSIVTPTNADLSQLSFVCRNQSAIVHYLQAFDIWLYTSLHQLAKQ